jgi:Zn-dependent M32 family carboxypeptidase
METINAWLKDKIHRHGGLLTPDELMVQATVHRLTHNIMSVSSKRNTPNLFLN